MVELAARFAALLIGSELLLGSGAIAVSAPSVPQLPSATMTYAQARALLVQQGLTVAPDKPVQADARFHELDCDEKLTNCEALFVWKRRDGWGRYVVIFVDRNNRSIVDARFARPMDGHPNIPPPEPADVPTLKGSYFGTRYKLRTLGYKPINAVWGPASVCADIACKALVELPEASCATDVPICNTFWQSPSGRVLRVMTMGEIRAGDIYFVTWSSPQEQRDLTR